jgi:hypothetical protein
MQRQDQIEAGLSLEQRWDRLSKPTKQAIYGIIAIVPTIGFAILAACLNNDYKTFTIIAAAASGAVSATLFGNSAYNYRQQLLQQQERQQDESTSLIIEPSP